MAGLLKAVKWLVALAVAAVVAGAAWITIAPPDLLRLGTAYAAKIVCSNVYVVGREPQAVLADDVQAPGHPLLKQVSVEADDSQGTVTAVMFGFAAKSVAIYRDGLGCASVPDGDVERARTHTASMSVTQPGGSVWPEGNEVQPSQYLGLKNILEDDDLIGPGMRAIVVVKNGRIAGETYGPGFGPYVPLLGWSMTKTVNAAIAGAAIRDGKLSLDKAGLFPEWTDSRKDITLADLMGMSAGLVWDEEYGDVTDVTRMLYLEPDMAGFTAAKPADGKPGETFLYSSGTSVLISRAWQDALGDAAPDYPQQALFGPLGMTSAVLEADARGTFTGSSYLYATARDWARFGLLLQQRGAWRGESLLPSGFVDWMTDPHPASKGEYGRGQVWLRGPSQGVPEGGDPDRGIDLPADTFWMLGHDGQSIAVVPSQNLVMVRMGLTPSRHGYGSQALLGAIIDELDD